MHLKFESIGKNPFFP